MCQSCWPLLERRELLALETCLVANSCLRNPASDKDFHSRLPGWAGNWNLGLQVPCRQCIVIGRGGRLGNRSKSVARHIISIGLRWLVAPAASPRPCVADSDWDSDCGSDSRVAAVVDLTRHRDICARAPAGRCERLHCPGPNCLNILLVRVPRSQPETPCCTCRGPPGPGTTLESVCTAPSHRLGAVR